MAESAFEQTPVAMPWLGKVIKHPVRQRSDDGLISGSHSRTAPVEGYGVS